MQKAGSMSLLFVIKKMYDMVNVKKEKETEYPA